MNVCKQGVGQVVVGNRDGGSLLRLLQNGHIRSKICHAERRKTVLSCTEEITGTSELEILLSNLESVCCCTKSF